MHMLTADVISDMATFYGGEPDTIPMTVKLKKSNTSTVNTSKLTTSAIMDTQTVSITPSRELALVKEYPPIPFANVKQMSDVLQSRRSELERGLGRSIYVPFSNVTPTSFVAINKHREQTGSKVRFTYFPDIATLIIKIPTKIHEQAHWHFSMKLVRLADRMGIRDSEFIPYGAATMKSENRPQRSQKEGDSTFLNRLIRQGNDAWPSLVIEAGNTESLPRLRSDAKWWIESSRGAVRIVVVIKVNRPRNSVTILKYVPGPRPVAYPNTQNAPAVVPVESATITIDQSVTPSQIQGTPLILEFDQVFSRQPNPPNERDLILTAADLDEWVGLLW
jgi:hypothetical protein